MSSGKLRGERSSSREHHSRDDSRKRSTPEQRGVPELNEEEYDEEWEHEWEDIDEIGRKTTSYHRPYGRNQNQKWRGRNQYRGQYRFNRWENKTHFDHGINHGSDGCRKEGRRPHPDEEENLEMPPGEGITNLKVKIQDGKRFAEPDEFEDFENPPEMRNQLRFSRGRGHYRGYHNVGRDKWIPHYRNKRSNESVDCREFLNRRKRHHPDPVESDLREKLLRKDHELGDLREIIESRETGPSDLRDIIEPPDMSLIEDLGDELLDEIDLSEDINLKIQNEYYEDGVENRDYHDAQYEDGRHHFQHVRDGRFTDDIPLEDVHDHRHRRRRTEEWPEEEIAQSSRRSQERVFRRQDGWHGRKKDHNYEWRDAPNTPVIDPSPRINRDSPKSRSVERMRCSPSRNFRERSLERGTRTRDLSWDNDMKTGRIPLRDGGLRMTLREDGGRQFSQERDRPFITDEEHLSPSIREHESRRSSRMNRLIEKRSTGPHRSESRTRSSSQETRRTISEKSRTSPGRDRRLRSISGEREMKRGGSVVRESHRSIGRSAERVSRANSRDAQRNRDVDRRMGRERTREERAIFAEGNIDGNRRSMLERQRDSDREKVQNRTRNLERDVVQMRGRDGERELLRETNRSGDPTRARSSSLDRNRASHQERKRSPGLEGARISRWGPERNPWLPGHEPELIPSRERGKSPGWGGPRTPSVERYRETGWGSGSSPSRNRGRSPVRERSRSRDRHHAGSSDRARDSSRGRRGAGSSDRARDDSRGRQRVIPSDRARDDSRGRRTHLKDKDVLRPKETERREKIQDPIRRRDFEQAKDQARGSRGHESGPPSSRHSEKDSNASLKTERNRKREHEDSTANKERTREKPRSPDHRNLQNKIDKKRPLGEDFIKKRPLGEDFIKKRPLGEDFIANSNRDNLQKGCGGPSQAESREWENIRDYQERRIPESVIGLPFLGEARRPRESLSHESHLRGSDSRASRNLPPPHPGLGLDPAENRQKKDDPTNWFDSKGRQPYNRSEEERSRSSRWASPTRRSKPSEHADSHKSAPHSMQSTPSTHHSSSNGKPDNDFWRRNLPSLGESQWTKPRSDLTGSSRDTNLHRPVAPYSKPVQSPREVIFLRGLARDIVDGDIRKDISSCGLWPKDVRVVYDNETGLSRGLAFVTFNSIDEANRWMELRNGNLNLRPNNHVAMEYSNPISKDWECVRCLTVNFKHRAACYQCNRAKEDCIDGWEETCPYPTNALLLRGLNPLTSVSELSNALKPRMIAQARLDGVKMGIDAKGRPRSVCFVQLTSVTDSMALHKSLVNDPLYIDNHQVMVAYCQLDKLPLPDSFGSQLHPPVPIAPVTMPPAAPLTLHSSLQSNNIPVVPRAAPAPPPVKPAVSTAEIRTMLEGNYTEKDIPTLAQYCASAYAKNPQEQAAYIRYYTKLYREKLMKNQTGGK